MVIAHALVVIIPLPYFIYKSNKDFKLWLLMTYMESPTKSKI
jgi:hypothetical protein